MKKMLVSVAAAVILATSMGAAWAKTKPVIVTLDGLCDSITITNSNDVYSVADDPKLCTTWYGTGRASKLFVRFQPDQRVIAVGMIKPSEPTVSYFVTFDYPLVTGGTFAVYATKDGLNGDGALIQSGTYTVGGTPDTERKGKPSASLIQH